jgi:hypothetical protein
MGKNQAHRNRGSRFGAQVFVGFLTLSLFVAGQGALIFIRDRDVVATGG